MIALFRHGAKRQRLIFPSYLRMSRVQEGAPSTESHSLALSRPNNSVLIAKDW